MAWRDPVTGKRTTLSTHTSNRQLANQCVTKQQDKLYRQQLGTYDPAEDHQGLTFKASKEEFLKAQTRRLRPQSVQAYKHSLVAFERLIKVTELRQVDRKLLDTFVTKRLEKVGGVTVNKDLRQIRAFLNWCKQQHYISRTPDFKGLFLIVDESEPTWVPDEDVKAVVLALNDRKLVLKQRSPEWWGVFLRTALFTGMRRSELLGLKWTEVDFRTGAVRVVRHTSKGRRDRLYESANELSELLENWFKAQPEPPRPTDFVLPYEKDPRGLYKDWDVILEHSGIQEERRFTPHDCRSTCVSEMLAAGVALTTVRDWVGHSSVVVTEQYYAATRTDRRRVASERKIV